MSEVALNPEAWAQVEAKPISTQELDQMIIDMQKAWGLYEAAKAQSTELLKTYEKLEGSVIETLKGAGKRKYHVDGLGLAYFMEKLVVTTPKTLEDKKAFFAWLHSKYGDHFLLDKQSINHQSLQKIYNDSYQEAVEEGLGAEFSIPGLAAPTARISLGFRKEK